MLKVTPKYGLQMPERSDSMRRQRAQPDLIQLLWAQRTQQDHQALRAMRHQFVCFLKMHFIPSLIRLKKTAAVPCSFCKGVIHAQLVLLRVMSRIASRSLQGENAKILHLMHAVTDAASLHLLQKHVGSLPPNVFWHQYALLTLHTSLRLLQAHIPLTALCEHGRVACPFDRKWMTAHKLRKA